MSFLEYTKEKILSLIRERTSENLYIEYKSARAVHKKDNNTKIEISRDVSSFANSDGGDIIYGICESKNGIPVEIDGTLDIQEHKEWLEQVINSNIQPRISGINVYSLEISSKHDKAVLVVNIPKSHTAHQAKDQKYWYRYGSEKLAMEDYQVRQTMNRMKEPVLEFVLKSAKTIELLEVLESKMNTNIIEMYLENKGVYSVKAWGFYFFFPRDILFMNQGCWEEDNNSSQQIDNTYKWRINEKDSQSFVIHPGERYSLSNDYDRNRFILSIQNEYLLWDRTIYGYYAIYAENMAPKYGRVDYIFSKGELNISSKRLDSLPYKY